MKALKRHYMLLIALVAILSVGVYSCKDDEDDESAAVTQQDRDFAAAVHRANLAEIQLSQLAVQRGTNDSVTTYATEMISDHSAARMKLDSIAGRLNISLPDSMSRPNQQLLARLSGLNGVDFDTTYISNQVVAHQSTRTLLEEQISRGDDQSLIDYAEEQLPIVNRHLQDAMRIRNSMDENEGGNDGGDQ